MNSFTSSRSFVALFLVLGGAAAGCQSGAVGADNVDQATQALSTDGAAALTSNDQSTTALTDATFEAVPSADPAVAADALTAAPPADVDVNCRSRAKDPSDPHTVIITLKNCTGRFGERHVSGKEIVHFSKGAAGVLHAEFTSQDLTVDGRPATHTALADITFQGTERHVVWQGAWDTTSAGGEAVAHTSDLTIDVDTVAHCRTGNGTAVTTIGSREIDSSIKSVKTCRDADGDAGCPTGEVTHTGKVSGRVLTVAFDGSDLATITTPKGVTFEKQMTCHE